VYEKEANEEDRKQITIKGNERGKAGRK